MRPTKIGLLSKSNIVPVSAFDQSAKQGTISESCFLPLNSTKKNRTVKKTLITLMAVAALVTAVQADERDHKKHRHHRDCESANYILRRQEAYQVEGVPTHRLIIGKRQIDIYRNGEMFEGDHMIGFEKR